ncbi:MAG: 30S ribosomal protein S11 [Verrucomicrobiota bacterium]
MSEENQESLNEKAEEAKPAKKAAKAVKKTAAKKKIKEAEPKQKEEPTVAKEDKPTESKAKDAEAPKTDSVKSEEAKPTAKKKSKAQKEDAKKEDKPASESLNLSLDEELPKPKIVKAKGSKNVSIGIVHISASFNNTLVSVSDARGNVLGWSSSGKCGFRGSKKSTAYVAQVVAQDACRQAMSHGLKEVEVRMKGPGSGRESAVRAVQAIGLEVTAIKDVTPIPHNGCRLRKQRRV